MDPLQTATVWMVASAPAKLDGVDPTVLSPWLAQLQTAATMAPPRIRTKLMVALVTATVDGAATAAAQTSLARPPVIAAAMAPRLTRTTKMVAPAPVKKDGVAILVIPTSPA